MESNSVKDENNRHMQTSDNIGSDINKDLSQKPVTVVNNAEVNKTVLSNNGITKVLNVSSDNDRIKILPNKSIRAIHVTGSNSSTGGPKIIRIKSENESPRKLTVSNVTLVPNSQTNSTNQNVTNINPSTNRKVVTISTNPGLSKSTSSTILTPIGSQAQHVQLQMNKKSQAFKISPKTVTITKPDFSNSQNTILSSTINNSNNNVTSINNPNPNISSNTFTSLAQSSNNNIGSTNAHPNQIIGTSGATNNSGYILVASNGTTLNAISTFGNNRASILARPPPDSSGVTEAKRHYFEKYDMMDPTGVSRQRASHGTTSNLGLTNPGSNVSNSSNTSNTGPTSSWQQYVRQYAHMGPCPVCEDSISGYHYGIFCCESCKGFFKRSVQNHKEYVCHVQQQNAAHGVNQLSVIGNDTSNVACIINKNTRKKCPACRFQKCIEKGMLVEAVRNDRSRGGRSLYPGAKNRVHRYNFDCTADSSLGRNVNLNSSETSPSVGFFKASLPTGSGNLHRALSSRGRTNMTSVLENIVSVEEGLSQEEDVLGPIVEDDDLSVYRVLLKLAEVRLHRMVRWSRCLPEFSAIDTDDQIALVQNCWAELLILDCCFRSLGDPREIHLTSGKCINLEAACELGANEIVTFLLSMTQRLKKLKFDIREFACLKVLLLMQPELKGLRAEGRVRMFQETVSQLLLDYTTQNYESDVPNKFYDLIMCLPEIRKAAGEVKQLLATKDLSQFLNSNSLLLELLNCYLPNTNSALNTSNVSSVEMNSNSVSTSSSLPLSASINQGVTIVQAGSLQTVPINDHHQSAYPTTDNILSAAKLADIEIDSGAGTNDDTTAMTQQHQVQVQGELVIDQNPHESMEGEKIETTEVIRQNVAEQIEVIADEDNECEEVEPQEQAPQHVEDHQHKLEESDQTNWKHYPVENTEMKHSKYMEQQISQSFNTLQQHPTEQITAECNQPNPIEKQYKLEEDMEASHDL